MPGRRLFGVSKTVRRGFTLVEIIVAMLLFTVGVLGVASTSAVVGRSLRVNSIRERAVRVAAQRIEQIAASCRGASGGSEMVEQIESRWTVTQRDSLRVEIAETVTYPSAEGRRTDTYRSLVECR